MKKIIFTFVAATFLAACSSNHAAKENVLIAQSCHSEGEATCTGSSSCKACKNCKYCKHCSKDGGNCGACK